jgi:hypothetical protein
MNEVPGWENMTVRYIQKTLQKRLGLPARNAAKKPLLTQKMKMKRLAFAWEDPTGLSNSG